MNIRVILVGVVLGFLSPVFADMDGFTISWAQPTVLDKGVYGRVHRLNDGRFMAVYRKGGGGMCRFSSDGCRTWSPARCVIPDFSGGPANDRIRVNVDNPEFAQLPDSHPIHPGRILYAVNLRPAKGRCDRFPYTIALSVSDDRGKTWSKLSVLHHSLKCPNDKINRRGCYEPFVLCLPNGVVQVYFADETPYAPPQKRFQDIALVESRDGGDTWSEAHTVCRMPGARDGMPVAMLQGETVVLAIESNPGKTRLHTQILHTPYRTGWRNPDRKESRYEPFEVVPDHRQRYAGAPYVAKTENFCLLSSQVCEGSLSSPQTAEVAAMRKTETVDGRLRSFRGMSYPFAGKDSRWNSLCPLGGDAFLLVSSVGGTIQTVRGEIRRDNPRPVDGNAVMAWRQNTPDPTTWREGGTWFASSTSQRVLTSNDFFTWRETGRKLLKDAEYRYWAKQGYNRFWAPDVAVVNGRTTLYLTCYRNCDDCLIAAYTSTRPGGPFTGRHVITRSRETGIRDTIDPEMVSDPTTGKNWLFFGSVGRIHRVELTEDGLGVKPGAPYTPVAGLTDRQDPSRRKVFEGAYLHRREGWWYLFASRGYFANREYAVVVGRSRSLEGTFVDKRGMPMLEGYATTVLASGNDPRFYGPGHNGEIRTLDGHDYLVYHCHVRDFPGAARTLFIRELFWDADGWPYVKADK